MLLLPIPTSLQKNPSKQTKSQMLQEKEESIECKNFSEKNTTKNNLQMKLWIIMQTLTMTKLSTKINQIISMNNQ